MRTTNNATVTVHVPLSFAVRGGRKIIISPANKVAQLRRFDDSLTGALARAHRWRQEIENGTYSSITELAKSKGLNESYACRLLRLTLLAPKVIEGILDGTMPQLSLKELIKPMPAVWIDQVKVLGLRLEMASRRNVR